MAKTTYRFNWTDGCQKVRRLSRSFDTLEQATRFAKGKTNPEVYVSKGKYKVEYIKVTDNN